MPRTTGAIRFGGEGIIWFPRVRDKLYTRVERLDVLRVHEQRSLLSARMGPLSEPKFPQVAIKGGASVNFLIGSANARDTVSSDCSKRGNSTLNGL